MISLNTIQRQKTEPVLEKARNVIRHYGRAADCLITVLDPDYNVVDIEQSTAAMFFCSVCKEYRKEHCINDAYGGFPCYAKHVDAVRNSCRLGGSQIYTCDLGFQFWTSPIFSGEHFAGALIGYGSIGVPQQQTVEKILEISGGEVCPEEIKRHLNFIPERKTEDIKALAQMMMICADRLSTESIGTEPAMVENYEADEPVNTSKYQDNSKDNENETKLLASLRRGDREEAQKILAELLESYLSDTGIRVLQIRAIELLTLVSRAAANSGNSDIQEILNENDRFLNKIDAAQDADEIIRILNSMINTMSGKMFSFHGVLHSSALRKAERFIWKNYARKISLKEIAATAGLSAPYFSTIFHEEMGIHLSHYINKLRVAKAAARLLDTNNSINKIAVDCGFEDQSWFSKIFKTETGISPGKFREYAGINGTPAWINDINHFQIIHNQK